MALTACVEAVEGILQHYEMPVGLRILLALMPVLPFAVLAKTHWRAMTQGDELARHIARETYVFAFYALVAVFICTDMLKTGGVLPDFAWKTKSLVYTMIGTLAVADGWTRWRYR